MKRLKKMTCGRLEGFLMVAVFAGICMAAWWNLVGANGPKDSENETHETVVWLMDYKKALEQAELEDKRVLIDFFATWCGPCAMMDRTTYRNAKVKDRLQKYVTLKIDVDRQPEIAGSYGISAMPTSLVVETDGKPVLGSRGYLDIDRFLNFLDAADERKSPTGKATVEEPSSKL